MTNTNTNNIDKVLDRAAILLGSWHTTESDMTYCELRGMESALAIMLDIDQSEAGKMIRDHKNKLDEKFDF